MSSNTSIAEPKTPNTDFEVRSLDTMCVNVTERHEPWYSNIKYMIVGILFGIVFVKSEVISWFRIQEMFRLQSFHMYGIIGSAVVVGMISVFLIKKFNIKTIHGEKIEFHDKKFNKGQIYGGLTFGLGWAIFQTRARRSWIRVGSPSVGLRKRQGEREGCGRAQDGAG